MISAIIPADNADRHAGFSAIARSVMISAFTDSVVLGSKDRFSAIARSVMISAKTVPLSITATDPCFSAIARSVMISALLNSASAIWEAFSFSAIARSVMISAKASKRIFRKGASVSVL